MGKIDLGGGGTIAQYMADIGIEVLDCGPGVLSMHSPLRLLLRQIFMDATKLTNVFMKIYK